MKRDSLIDWREAARGWGFFLFIVLFYAVPAAAVYVFCW